MWGLPVSTALNEVDQIRRQMALLRRDMHEDVRGVVQTAEAATNWRRYLSMYPWVTLGAGLAVGYLVVPRRAKPTAAVVTQADLSKVREAVETTRQSVADVGQSLRAAEPTKEERKKGLIGAALGMLVPLALRTAQGYALKYAEQWILQQQLQRMQAGPPPGRPEPRQEPGQVNPEPRRPSGPRYSTGPGF